MKALLRDYHCQQPAWLYSKFITIDIYISALSCHMTSSHQKTSIGYKIWKSCHMAAIDQRIFGESTGDYWSIIKRLGPRDQKMENFGERFLWRSYSTYTLSSSYSLSDLKKCVMSGCNNPDDGSQPGRNSPGRVCRVKNEPPLKQHNTTTSKYI